MTVETENIPATAVVMAVSQGSGGARIAKAEGGTAVLSADGAETVKVFVWDSFESMKPLCEAKTVKEE